MGVYPSITQWAEDAIVGSQDLQVIDFQCLTQDVGTFHLTIYCRLCQRSLCTNICRDGISAEARVYLNKNTGRVLIQLPCSYRNVISNNLHQFSPE